MRTLRIVVHCACACALISPALAGGIAAPTPAAEVSEILEQEISSERDINRREALADLRAQHASPALWWQSGFVRSGEDWSPWEDTPAESSEVLRRYRIRRSAATEQAEDQWQLADWCREQGLPDQERVHLFQALWTGRLPHPDRALRRLGYRHVGGQWYTEAELKTLAEQLADLSREWKRLRPRLDSLSSKLAGKPSQREQALAELRKLISPSALPILEQTLAIQHEAAAQGLVSVVAESDSCRATQSLARLAIAAEWESVRAAAIEQLKSRPWDHFIPFALSLMHQPVDITLQTGAATPNILGNPAGGREWRFLFTREGRERIELAAFRVIDCRFIPLNDADRRRPVDFFQQRLSHDTARSALDSYQRWIASTDELNDQGEFVNERIGKLLQAVTDVPIAQGPTDWWTWWDDLTDAPLAGQKSVVIVQEDLQKIEAPIRKSCLAAGTPVWTETGFVPIEQIRLGDRVLSKHPETGELSYQPVLTTTRREGARLVKLHVGDEIIWASQGHHFWISGKGWTRARELASGMRGHTATGSVPVSIEQTDRTADVFNLVVADAHSYFVGTSLLLGHDVLVPAPSDVRVPGLLPDRETK